VDLIRAKSLASRLRVGLVLGSLVIGTGLLSAGAQAQPVASTLAAGASSTISAGIQVQNLSPTSPANVTINYYNPDGTAPNPASQSFQIAAAQSTTIFGASMLAPAGFKGSAVISSDQPVVAITNLLGSNPTIGEAYDGVGSTQLANKVFAPIFLQGIGSPVIQSTLYVQNASATPQTVTVTFTPNGGAAMAPLSFGLNAWGSVGVDNTNDMITGSFVGSATVQGTGPIAIEANQTNGLNLFSQAGSGTGGPTVYAPLVMFHNGIGGTLSTGLQVQNIGTVSTNLTLTVFYPDGSSQVIGTPVSVGAGASFTWYPITGMTQRVGSAVVTNSANQSLLGIVNELDSATGQASAYNTFASGTQLVNFPLIMFNNSTNYTGEQVQNIGTCDTTVTLTVTPQGGAPIHYTQLIKKSSGFTWFNPTVNILGGSARVGSAVVSTPDACASLVGIANEITFPQAPGDTSFAYEGFNQ